MRGSGEGKESERLRKMEVKGARGCEKGKCRCSAGVYSPSAARGPAVPLRAQLMRHGNRDATVEPTTRWINATTVAVSACYGNWERAGCSQVKGHALVTRVPARSETA